MKGGGWKKEHRGRRENSQEKTEQEEGDAGVGTESSFYRKPLQVIPLVLYSLVKETICEIWARLEMCKCVCAWGREGENYVQRDLGFVHLSTT